MKNMNRYLSLVALIISLISCQSEDNPNRYELIPYPNDMEQMSGRFSFDDDTQIFISPECGDEVNEILAQFAEQFGKTAGKDLKIAEKEGKNMMVVKIDTTMSQEAYRLNISKKKIEITAATPNGVRYALQTIKQLLPVAIYGESLSADENWSVPCTTINDAPRFGYRGMHLDVARHFFTLDEVKRILNVMAVHKLNTLHWHLTDDQGWRVEIKKYPRLTEVGSIRNKTMIRKEWDNYDTTPYGGFYTQDELRDMVKYAADLGITIIPEIDLPGHMMAALASYPELGCTGGPYEVSGQWGIRDDVLCVGKEKTFEFIENVLLEIIDIFPSKYIHIGGDECPKIRWEKCPACQARIQKLGLKDDEHGKAEHYLQSYTTERIEKFLNEHGREIIGWDEMLEGGLTTNATVMSWRGVAGGVEAAKQGHYAIMTPTAPLYLDYYQSRATQNEPLAIGGYNPVDMVYNFNPIPESLTEEQAKFILGTQANIWTEYITTPEHLEYMILPRLAALSEVQWDQVENKSYDRFLDNIGHILAIYDVMGLNYAKHILEVKGEYSVNETKGCIEATLRTQGNAPIYYTLDGSEPTTNSTRYTEPIEIRTENDSCTLKAIVVREGIETRTLVRPFKFNKATGHMPQLKDAPSEKYTFGGAGVLTDGIHGDFNYSNGCWLGFINTPLDATIDLGKTQTISQVKIGSLVQYSEYIFPPTQIKVYATNGDNPMTEIGKLEIPVTQKQDQDGVREYTCEFPAVPASKIRVVIDTTDKIPAWHGAKGEKGWLFVDEISVN
ncbi:beta-N-acetylhexosaminidase [Barnesiella intestinihominis]|uniref:beta-N-acetylhexosaminidase n=1 Tax=Barnesiella intestinihominis TaxID=487174 RepID=UPI003AB90533